MVQLWISRSAVLSIFVRRFQCTICLFIRFLLAVLIPGACLTWDSRRQVSFNVNLLPPPDSGCFFFRFALLFEIDYNVCPGALRAYVQLNPEWPVNFKVDNDSAYFNCVCLPCPLLQMAITRCVCVRWTDGVVIDDRFTSHSCLIISITPTTNWIKAEIVRPSTETVRVITLCQSKSPTMEEYQVIVNKSLQKKVNKVQNAD